MDIAVPFRPAGRVNLPAGRLIAAEPLAHAVTFTDDTTGTNPVTFHSGGGDGVCFTWLGTTAAGDAACFVTDFG